jgi:hypothetical protein
MFERDNKPSNLFRSASRTHSLSRSLSKSDDTFSTAKLVGVLKSSSVPIVIQAKGVVGKSDRVDVFKFQAMPGADFPTYTDTYNISGGTVKVSAYWQHPDLTNNQIQFGGSSTLKGSSSLFYDNHPTNNTSFDPITAYLKISTTGKRVKYDIKATYNPF